MQTYPWDTFTYISNIGILILCQPWRPVAQTRSASLMLKWNEVLVLTIVKLTRAESNLYLVSYTLYSQSYFLHLIMQLFCLSVCVFLLCVNLITIKPKLTGFALINGRNNFCFVFWDFHLTPGKLFSCWLKWKFLFHLQRLVKFSHDSMRWARHQRINDDAADFIGH